MRVKAIRQCGCAICQCAETHPKQEEHHLMNVFMSRLDEQNRRWYAALEAKKLGHGGLVTMAQITGLHVNTIRRGQKELTQDLSARPTERVRVVGGGRKAVEKKPNARKSARNSGFRECSWIANQQREVG